MPDINKLIATENKPACEAEAFLSDRRTLNPF